MTGANEDGNGGAFGVAYSIGSSGSPWHKSAPKGLRAATGCDGWAQWTRHLARRKRPKRQGESGVDWAAALLWGLPAGIAPPRLEDCSVAGGRPRRGGRTDGAVEKRLLGWLGESAGAGPDVAFALEALAWCMAMPGLAPRVSPDAWWELLGHLMALVQEAQSVAAVEEPLWHQLLAGELAWSLACLLPEIKACHKLRRTARRAFAAGLSELTDEQGMLQGRNLGHLRPLLACWTRSLARGVECGQLPWDQSGERRYQRFVQNALRFARRDGSHAFQSAADRGGAELLAAAVGLAGDEDDRDLAAVALPKKHRGRGRGKGRSGRVSVLALPGPAIHSEWSAAAVLRRTWKPGSERLAVDYSGRGVGTDLAAGRDVFWSGAWGLEIRIDGRPSSAASDWREVVWVSDDDVDYLEIEADFEGGLLVQRHILLAREDRFLLLADSVMGQRAGRIEYCGRLPLWPGVRWEPAAETHEGVLVGPTRRALGLPLDLPEWRSDSRTVPRLPFDPSGAASGDGRGLWRNELRQTAAGLELRQAAAGASMMAPLFFDLAPKRRRGPATWRQLTVAEAMQTVARDVAVGYRVAAGKRQWLIYRSLGARANRTVLGQNFASDMVVARFLRNGEHEVLVELE